MFYSKFSLLDPDPHIECGSRSRRENERGSGSTALVSIWENMHVTYCCIYICSGYSILRVLRRRKRAAYVYRTNLWMSARICWRFFAQFLLWKHAVICVFFWHGYCIVTRSVADPDNFCPAPDPSDIEVRIWLRIRLRIQILDIKKIEQF